MKLILFLTFCLIVLPASAFASCTDGTVYVLDASVKTLALNNSGPLGGSRLIAFPVTDTNRAKFWCSTSGYYPQRATEFALTGGTPSVSTNLEYGNGGYWYEITDSSGTPLSPVRVSSRNDLPFIQQPAISAPFTIPLSVHGSRGYITAPMNFTPAGGTDVSQLYVWVYASGSRNGLESVVVNGIEHVFQTQSIWLFTCDGVSTCTATTDTPHGLTTGQLVQTNFFREPAGQATANGYFNVTVTGPKTFTFPTVLFNGDLSNSNHRYENVGKTVSATTFCADETRYFGCLQGNHQAIQLLIPLGSSEVTAGQVNTIAFKFKGADPVSLNGLNHGFYVLDWNIIQGRGVEISKLVTGGGLTTVATLTSSVPMPWQNGDTVVIWDAPGPYWRFNGKRIIGSIGTDGPTTVHFDWGPDTAGDTPGVSPWLTANSTYTLPTTSDATTAQAPHMYAAHAIIPKSSFQYLDPSTYPSFGGNATNGKTAFTTTTLKDPNNFIPNNVSLATCTDCHVNSAPMPGYDLKYFSYPPNVIRVAALDRGMSETQANDIVAYIASLSVGYTSRPWDPVFQPAVGADSARIDQWAASGKLGGLRWHLTYDQDMCEYLMPGAIAPGCTGGSYSAWASNQTINLHELPVWMQLPTWNMWLPRVSPRDFAHYALGPNSYDFTTDPMWTQDQSYANNLVAPGLLSSGVNNSVTTFTTSANYGCANNDLIQVDSEIVQVTAGCGTSSLTVTRAYNNETAAASHLTNAILSDYTKWKAIGSSGYFFDAYVLYSQVNGYGKYHQAAVVGFPSTGGSDWPALYNEGHYESGLKWANAHIWGHAQVFWLENLNTKAYIDSFGSPNARAAPMVSRGYPAFTFQVGPHKSSTGVVTFDNRDQHAGVNFDYMTINWYHLTAIINTQNKFMLSAGDIDQQYYNGFNHAPYRPMFHMAILPSAFLTQQSAGFNTITNGGNPPNSRAWEARALYGFHWVDLFTSEAQKQEYVQTTAHNLALLSALYTTGDWQGFSPNIGGCTNAQAPSPANAYNNVTACLQDNMAFALPIMNYFGVGTTDKNTLVTWLNNVFQGASGHDFGADWVTATYTNPGSTPPRSLCPHNVAGCP
jgi:hypothetical protein